MITENQLNEAIAEMQGQRNPNASTCMKLASYYTIKNELFPQKRNEETMIDNSYSFAAPPEPEESTIAFDSGTEFSRSINGRNIETVLKKLDEIVSAVYVIDPDLYRRIMRDLND